MLPIEQISTVRDSTFLDQTVSVPEHRLIRVIGRGSYGEVWLAVNVLGRYRAIKVVSRAKFRNSKPFEREFSGIQKFEPLSRNHSGFVPILQIGSDSKQEYFYYVMELADDVSDAPLLDPDSYQPRTLSSEKARRYPIAECIRIGISLGEALQFLHSHGLVHRDVKPSNVLFVDRTPKLADIGMVASLDESMSFVGTEGFIPPEGPGTVQADIYSLGKLLYEICTGKDRMEFPAFPEQEGFSEWTGFLELNEVLITACQTDRSRRYQTADELVADLKALSVGKSVVRLRRLERQVSLMKRVASIIAMIALIATAVLTPVYQAHQVRRDEREREVGRNLANGLHALEAGDYYDALPSLLRACELGDARKRRTHLVRLHRILAQCPKLTWMAVEDGAISGIDFSSDNKHLLTSTLYGVAALHHLESEEAPIRVHHPGLRRASFAPDGASFLTVGDDQWLRLWDVKGKLLSAWHESAQIYSAAYSPSGKLIALGQTDGKVVLWDRDRATNILEIEQGGLVESVAFSPDEKLLATAGQNSICSIWNLSNGERIQGLQHSSWVFDVGFSPDAKRLATACFDRGVRAWDTLTGIEKIPVLRHRDGVKSANFSPDGRYLLSASYDSSAKLWNAYSGNLVPPSFPQSARAMDAKFSADCNRIAVGCWDGSVRVYDLSSVEVPESRGIREFSSDLRLYAEVENKTVMVKRTSSGELIHSLELSEAVRCIGLYGTFNRVVGLFEGSQKRYILDVTAGSVEETRISEKADPIPSKGRFISIPDDESLLVLNHGGTIEATLFGLRDKSSISFSPAESVFCLYVDRHLELRELSKPATPKWSFDLDAPIKSVSFSPDGTRVVVAAADSLLNERSALIFRVNDGTRLGLPLKHRDGVLSAKFSPDGTRIVTAGEDFSAFVWDAASGKLIAGPLKHEDQITDASFSSDGEWVVTASQDHSARVWDARSGEPITPPLWHDRGVKKAQFLENDKKIAVQTVGGEVFLWSLNDGEEILKQLPEFIDLTTGKILGDWKSTWKKAQQLGLTERSQEKITEWHARQAISCSISTNHLGEALHLKYIRQSAH